MGPRQSFINSRVSIPTSFQSANTKEPQMRIERHHQQKYLISHIGLLVIRQNLSIYPYSEVQKLLQVCVKTIVLIYPALM